VAAESFLSTLLSHDRQMNVTQPTVAAAPAHKPRGRQPKDKEPVPAGVQAPSLPGLPAGMVPIAGAATVPVVTVNDSEEDREVEDTIMRVMQAASPTSSSPPAYTPTASGVSRAVPGSASVNTPKSNMGSFAFGSAAKPAATPTADVTSIFLRDDMDESESDSRRHSIQVCLDFFVFLSLRFCIVDGVGIEHSRHDLLYRPPTTRPCDRQLWL
jgi:hypothetical protein